MPYQNRCPICQSSLSPSVRVCPVCGARLPEPTGQPGPGRQTPVYSPDLGEDDLYAPRLLRFPWWGVVVPIVAIGVVLLGVVVFATASFFGRAGLRQPGTTSAPLGGSTPVPTLALGGATPESAPGSTAMATLFMPTLTPAPPPTNTPPPTDTPGPCEQVVEEGDTLLSLASRCGHRHLDVVDAIIDLNGLRSAESIQIGQRIFIPWPTPTPGAPLDAASTGQAGTEEGNLPEETGAELALAMPGPGPTLTPTLQPGVMWYTVQPGDTIIAIALQFDANVEILSQLNPEVTFSQCDFGMDSGGPNCIVNLFEGQRLRVPAPTPTPTLSPTPSGSETATPTPTPTYNAPALLSPGDRALFRADELITLRWVTTGTLAEGDVYLVTVRDLTAGVVHTATTTETLFIIPPEWQPADGQRHTFSWNVAIGPADGRGELASETFRTDSRLFSWDSR